MAGSENPESQDDESTFAWDENSQLYFHARSGFYHDPIAGWYYSCSDGLYYKFEDGNYVLFESEKGNESVPDQSMENLAYESTLDEPCHTESCSSHENDDVISTSEWLEDTLIDLYLSGYSNPSVNATADVNMPLEADVGNNINTSPDGGSDLYELEEGEWIPENHGTNEYEELSNEDVSLDEEKWKAQYGQVMQCVEESRSLISVMDLWDWATSTGCRKNGSGQGVRLVGRLVKRSSKLHPSMPYGGGLFKTAPICEVHLDLVRVTSGRVYKLRTPSARYLASLSIYDSSNPTKDWGFPDLSVEEHVTPFNQVRENFGSNVFTETNPISGKHESSGYRDRAAERRKLHGGFGIGPGQKSVLGDDDVDSPSFPVDSASAEIAAAEALSMSFGAGSYARKLLENMGWKEGETLGKTMKGLKEPLKAIGNKGNAGLGWENGITEHL